MHTDHEQELYGVELRKPRVHWDPYTLRGREVAVNDENVETIRRWFAALQQGDPAPEMCDPEIEIRNWAESPIPGPYVGHEGVQQWWDDVSDAFDEVHFGFWTCNRSTTRAA
jgi:hypothetical protein